MAEKIKFMFVLFRSSIKLASARWIGSMGD